MWTKIGFMIWLGALGIMDIRTGKAPIWLMAAGSVAAAVFACYQCVAGAENWGVLFCSLIPGVILLAVWKLTGKVGCADGIVLLAVGMLLKAGGFVVFVLSMFVLSLVSVFLLFAGKAGRNTKIPYLPFLWLACLIRVCWM